MNLRTRTRIGLVIVAAAAVGLAATGCAKDRASTEQSDTRARAARLQRINSVLQRQIELARSKQFYLVLDPDAADMTLMLSGAELQRYPVAGLQVGRPQVSWIRRGDPRPWQDVIWTQGELDPPRAIDRLVIEAAPPGKEVAQAEDPPVPPTPEELYPVPSRYLVRFDEGRSIEVRAFDADAQAGRLARLRAWWGAQWRDAIAATVGASRDAVRLRIVLNPNDVASLYRSLPPAVRLVILSQDRPATTGRQPAAGRGSH